jgi:hypothetical protein
MPRSLKVRQDCIGIVKLAVRRNGFPSQQALAEELGLARSTVVNFLTGKPVDRAVFEDICLRLSLDCREIAEFDFETPSVSGKEIQIESRRNDGDLGEAPDLSIFQDSRVGRLSAVEAQVMDFVFYVERPPIEERCYSEILKPGMSAAN